MSPPPLLIHRVIARLNVGGPAMHVVNLAGAMNEGPWRTRLIAGVIEDDEGDMGYYADDRGVAVSYVPAMARSISPLDDLRTLWQLFSLFRRERPNIVHTHTAKAGTLGRVAAVLAGVPVVIHTYHGHVLGGDYFAPWKTQMFAEIERQLGRLSNRLVVLTHRQAEEMALELGVASRDRFAVVPLGLELKRFLEVEREAQRPGARAELGVAEDEITLGIVGRMVPIKNHELFLDVVADFAAQSARRVRALVVGSGEREGELRAYADSIGIGDQVTWLGWRQDLPHLYPAIDVLLLTSHDEGTPVAVIEALVCGTPVVARDVGGVAEMLAEAGSGTVVAREAHIATWVDATRAGSSAPPASRAGREAIARRFSVQRLADDLASLYATEIE